jgi:hypothetical protein
MRVQLASTVVETRDMELRDAIQKIAVEWPSYGRPRDDQGAAAARVGGECQTGSPSQARGQLAVAIAEIRGNHRFQPRSRTDDPSINPRTGLPYKFGGPL